jgi:hypothetical protein
LKSQNRACRTPARLPLAFQISLLCKVKTKEPSEPQPHPGLESTLSRNVGSEKDFPAGCSPVVDHRRDTSLTMDGRIPGTHR